jgi:hypothetical protein
MKLRFFITTLIFVLPVFYNLAATLESNGTGGGDWESASSWDGTDTPSDLSDGDTLTIQLGDTITIYSNLSFNGVVQVYGVLVFDGGKINMDSNSSIQLATGSDIIALGSGQSDQIRIGNSSNKISKSEINNLTTPNQLTEGSLTGGGCAVTGDCEADPLPVKILYFKALVEENSIRLKWCTTFEKDFDFFTIERSKNGIIFKNHARIYSIAKNSSQNTEYEFTDELPFGGLSYYRLKATDLSGFSEFHGILAVRINNSGPEILVYPNPSIENYIMVSFSGDKETLFKINSITGSTVEKGILQPGINQIQFENNLKPGFYFIQIETTYTDISKKFIVK